MSSLVGRKLGIYEIRSLLGQGGMASVYLGYRADVDRQVAIKVLPPHPGLSSDAKQRFQNEARTVANLQHPHILPLYDYGATADDVLYLVMPYIQGGSLDQLMRKGRVPLPRIERLMRELSGALDLAHKQGVIHRDIKPANVMLDSEGNALLADFGIAKMSTIDSNLTGTGVVGTPAYMSPEQAQGFDLTARSDLYSFGVVIWEMLTGKALFDTDNPMTMMMKHVTEAVPLLSMRIPVSSAIDAVMMKALAKDPKERYQTATAFYDAFSKAIRDGGMSDNVLSPSDAGTVRLANANPLPVPQPTGQDGKPYQTQLPPTMNMTPSPQTIIVQQGSSGTATNVILGVALLVMLLALVIVVAVLGGQGNNLPDTNTVIADGTPSTPRGPDTAAQTLVAEARPSFGRLSFVSINAVGDGLSLSLREVRPAPPSSSYVAWLLNTRTGDLLKLGTVAVDAIGTGAFSYTNPDGAFLPTLYNALLLTVEDNPQAIEEPSEVVYHGLLPIQLSDALIDIFVVSDFGLRGRGLLETAHADARFTTQHAGLAARAPNVGAMRTHIEHTLNILLGGEQDFDGNGRASNPGTKIGLLTTLENINNALTEATNAPNANLVLQTEAELIRVCVENVRLWSEEIIAAEQNMLTFETLEEAAPLMEISTGFADILSSGIDQNQNGEVEPFEGECGLDQIEQFGLVVATMDINQGTLEVR